MISPEYIRLMAAYSHWQNTAINNAAEMLSDSQRRQQRQLFFGSIHATVSHLLWGDQLWLHRLAGTPAPAAPDIPNSLTLYAEWTSLRSAREETDQWMLDWGRRADSRDLTGELSWFSGAVQRQISRPRWVCAIQLFNHGTHHRGQVHAALTQAGAKTTDTDVPFMDSPQFPW